MNTQPSGTPASLPQLTPERIDEIEGALFADIARERARQTDRRTRRGRLWLAGGAAAAVIAVAAVIAPSVGSLVNGSGGSSSDESAVAPVAPADGAGSESGSDAAVTDSRDAAPLTIGPESSGQGAAGGVSGAAQTDRDIITTASATVRVDEVDAAVRAIGNSAVAHGGYVESMSVGGDGTVYPMTPEGGMVYDTYPAPEPTDGAWITVRVPSDQLTGVVEELDDVGEVTATNVSRQDVTDQTLDLEARIEAAEASVDRLTALMAQAESVADLIAAESALAERQALLESYQQQLDMLDDQVAMSTLSVTIVPDVEPVAADPAGFGDGLAAGWNGLVATLNGIVVALGFLIPWLAVAAVVGFVVWGIVRLVRRRRQRRADEAARAAASVSDERG
ncbi:MULTISPECIES: DUF4349 domain-containing protein [Microbacterium]|uniref:DUF4349 domain-containing protein n=1 Tax=Microbacterium TaxID=33882 RepID=UPI000D65659C|nr:MULTISPECIES: DUF4349 domain-containing protein [Microbacterium]